MKNDAVCLNCQYCRHISEEALHDIDVDTDLCYFCDVHSKFIHRNDVGTINCDRYEEAAE